MQEPGVAGVRDRARHRRVVPTPTSFRASVERQLGYDPFRATADKRVVVQIARKEVGFDGRIRWSDAEGHWVGDRRLSSRRADCGEIAASVAFSVAVQIQLLATLAPAPIADRRGARGARDAPAPPASTHTEVRVAPERPAGRARLRSRSRFPRAPPSSASWFTLSIGAGPSLAIGVAPHTAGLGRLFVSGRVGHFSLELAGDAALPVTQQERAAADSRSIGSPPRPPRAAMSRRSPPASPAPSAGCRRTVWASTCERRPIGWFSQLGARLAAAYDFSDRYFAAARVDGLVMTAPTQ